MPPPPVGACATIPPPTGRAKCSLTGFLTLSRVRDRGQGCNPPMNRIYGFCSTRVCYSQGIFDHLVGPQSSGLVMLASLIGRASAGREGRRATPPPPPTRPVVRLSGAWTARPPPPCPARTACPCGGTSSPRWRGAPGPAHAG